MANTCSCFAGLSLPKIWPLRTHIRTGRAYLVGRATKDQILRSIFVLCDEKFDWFSKRSALAKKMEKDLGITQAKKTANKAKAKK